MADPAEEADVPADVNVERKIEVLQGDIPEGLQKKAIDRASIMMGKTKIEKDIATDMKKHFDETVGGTWHCVTGRCFGCSVTHATEWIFFFKCDNLYVLLFRSQE
ncbi:unnamed protein product [Chrysoparadoxa australica]